VLTVACCWWGYYPAEYVENLQKAVQKYLTVPHRFVCLTDNDAPCETLPLDTDLPGNMKLMSLYRPDNGLEGRILALDLDSLIVGSLDDIASYDGAFCTARDFNSGDMDGFLRSFVAGEHEYLWHNASDDYSMEIPYFQNQLKGVDYWQDLYPGQLASYKNDCRTQKAQHRPLYPENTRIISFHGKPKIHEVKWARELWTN